jgi:hypothetical protein
MQAVSSRGFGIGEAKQVEWLLSAEARVACEQAREMLRAKENVLRIVKRLRNQLSPAHAAMAMELAQLQIKTTVKFSRGEQMLFTRTGYEQSSSETIAKYKADLIPESIRVVDVCSGIGGDALGLAVGRSLRMVESQSLLCKFSAANLKLYGHHDVEIVNEPFSHDHLAGMDAIHIDPDRRIMGRTVLPSDFSPPLLPLLDLNNTAITAIKIAPATRLPDDVRARCHAEWIGERRETKQQVIWLNHPRRWVGSSTATVLDSSGRVTQVTFPNDVRRLFIDVAQEIGSFVFEPHSVVLAAGLNRGMAREHGLQRLGPGVAYLTGAESIATPLMACFEVLRVVPLHLDRIARAVGEMKLGHVDWKKRAIEQQTFEQLKKIRLKGDVSATAIVSPSAQGPIVVFCRRFESRTA